MKADRQDSIEDARAQPPGERGFTLMIALLVMALLTTLGLTLMFTSETERAISRNFSGQIQATYAAEAIVDAAANAFTFDLRRDRVGGWANRYLVVCDVASETRCLDLYGFNPKLASCYNAAPASSCVFLDSDGSLTGSSGNWVAELTWRPSGARPPLPSQVPTRLHPDLKAVMPWWKKFDLNTGSPEALDTGSATLAIANVCTKNCATAGSEEWSKDTVYLTGIGESSRKLMARITHTKNPATRAISVRMKGDLLSLWGNALVGGTGDPTQIIKGDYVIRGSVLMLNDSSAKKVMVFSGTDTGIVNNYYDTDSLPAISSWWWKDARNCSVAGCDANNTASNGGNFDIDNTSSTASREPIFRHLPDPPDMDTTDNDPGGYRADDTEAYPGPEGLSSIIRLRAGIIELGSSGWLGRQETFETGTAEPGNFWDNVLDIYMNDSTTQSPTEIDGAGKTNVRRNRGAKWNLDQKSGAFDVDATQLKFPKLTDPYTEPLTREQYTNFYDFLRPADPAAHPGGWGLNLSGIDGKYDDEPTPRENVNFGTFDDGAECWPHGDIGAIPASPSLVALEKFFGDPADTSVPATGMPMEKINVRTWYRTGTTYCYYQVKASNGGGPGDCGPSFDLVDCSIGGSTRTSCNVNLEIDLDMYDPPVAPAACATSITFPIYRRDSPREGPPPGDYREIAVDDTLNFDSSSSLDTPKGRAQATMFNSFAYRLYVDLLSDLAGGTATCSSPNSLIYRNNLQDLPAAYNIKIPAVYRGVGSSVATQCDPQQGPCFQERSAYMDVHIQLTDAPRWRVWRTGVNPEYRRDFAPSGRWLSIRYRAPSNPDGLPQMEVLSDPRAGESFNDPPFATTGCATTSLLADTGSPITDPDYPMKWTWPLQTDIPAEVRDVTGTGADHAVLFPRRFPGSATAFDPTDWDSDGGAVPDMPRNYFRALPTDPGDNLFRNMPTGAFVVALHLPCTTDTSPSNKNPYKCTQSDSSPYSAPNPSYPGFYTHTLAWGPKYTCWKAARQTWSGPRNAPPSPATGMCDGACGSPTIAWFAQSLWVTNHTTLWNDPPVIPGGDKDDAYAAGGAGLPENIESPTLLGYRLNVPYAGANGALGPIGYVNQEASGCAVGFDLRTDFNGLMSTLCTGAGVVKSVPFCSPDLDGVPCNGNATKAAGCDTGKDNVTYCPFNPCQDEPDREKFWNSTTGKFDARAYGGCNEIFSPIVELRNASLSPETGPEAKRDSYANRISCPGAGFPLACPAAATSPACFYAGNDPDDLAGWDSSETKRYFRPWPGWGSFGVLGGAGLAYTNGPVRFGSPDRTCEKHVSPICKDSGTLTARSCYNCDSNAAFVPAETINAATSPQKRGFYSDPVVFDGRLILYSGGSTSEAGTSKVFLNDHVLPRTKFGCSDFLSVLSMGDTEVRMEMPYDAASKRHLLASFSLSQGSLKVTTPDGDVQTEMVGSWIADAADFGTHATYPVQIIGTPTVSGKACDHPYLPGRDPIPQRQYVSFVEDELLKGAF